jgi:hypothetical protein
MKFSYERKLLENHYVAAALQSMMMLCYLYLSQNIGVQKVIRGEEEMREKQKRIA